MAAPNLVVKHSRDTQELSSTLESTGRLGKLLAMENIDNLPSGWSLQRLAWRCCFDLPPFRPNQESISC